MIIGLRIIIIIFIKWTFNITLAFSNVVGYRGLSLLYPSVKHNIRLNSCKSKLVSKKCAYLRQGYFRNWSIALTTAFVKEVPPLGSTSFRLIYIAAKQTYSSTIIIACFN